MRDFTPRLSYCSCTSLLTFNLLFFTVVTPTLWRSFSSSTVDDEHICFRKPLYFHDKSDHDPLHVHLTKRCNIIGFKSSTSKLCERMSDLQPKSASSTNASHNHTLYMYILTYVYIFILIYILIHTQYFPMMKNQHYSRESKTLACRPESILQTLCCARSPRDDHTSSNEVSGAISSLQACYDVIQCT